MTATEKIVAEVMDKQKELCVKAEHLGYKSALADLMSELNLKKADGFVIDNLLVWELMEMLNNKNDKNYE